MAGVPCVVAKQNMTDWDKLADINCYYQSIEVAGSIFALDV
jgi:hypothetical protein